LALLALDFVGHRDDHHAADDRLVVVEVSEG
jgi:hypothetical protein